MRGRFFHPSAWNRSSRKFNVALPAPIAHAAATSEGIDYLTEPVLFGALAFIMLVFLAALYMAIILHQRGLLIAPSPCCTGSSVVRP